ncbi:hypothetical protein L218DRAFT_889026 [Marasmius fiardii PR-910]|nr:hypothetical protein L218DRAFT_889026 [Marasmius fiardii PR-910]
MQSKTAPPHWPKELTYIRTCHFHRSVSSEARAFIHGNTTKRHSGQTVATAKSYKPQNVVIRRISNNSHPANGQSGLFSSRKIPPKTYIIDYIGELHSDVRPTSDYDLSLYRFQESEEGVGIDASRMGNEGRFINDYRGVKNKPNAVFVDYRTSTGELRMGVWSGSEEIKKGDEILVSYGKSWWKARMETESEERLEIGTAISGL